MLEISRQVSIDKEEIFCEKDFLTKYEKETILNLICNKQISMIIKDHTMYSSKEYSDLEKLKVKVKDMKECKDGTD